MLKKEYLEANGFSAHLERVLFYCFQSGKDLKYMYKERCQCIKLSYAKNLDGQWTQIVELTKKDLNAFAFGRLKGAILLKDCF